ncbi:hypothetical protein B0H67DRAFT_572497 [Lasiosphaeris hirsuta]|uniref:Uncharacterized protein n=1 Tax=Lasiosphaeris hirsuta TaxID=260670 RepID=A0AA40DZU5_9PEZI|nr:hypothetical protein B0H67DRAFT_572497 [Lasiosphaeris hirsuta]
MEKLAVVLAAITAGFPSLVMAFQIHGGSYLAHSIQTISTVEPVVCTSSATATWFATTGCEIPCPSTARCIADLAVTVPCGCDRVRVTVTTTTRCPGPSITTCYQCQTGWGLFTVRLPCPTTPPEVPTTTATALARF